jgi:hypothetical protein
MAQQPLLEQTVLPQQGVQPQASPADFGAQVGEAQQNFGSALGKAGDTLAEQTLRTRALINEANARQADIGFQTDLGKAESDYYSLSGKAAVDAYPAYVQQITSLRGKYLASMTNPMAQQMLDQTLSYTAGRSIRSAASHAGEEMKKWVVDTSDARVQNLITGAAQHPLDDGWFKAAQGSIASEVDSQAKVMGWSPEQVTQQKNKYDSDLWMERIRIVSGSDIAAAQKMFDEHADEIDPAHRAVIDQNLQNRAYTQMARDIALQNHIDSAAEKALRATQDSNAANLVADTLSGKPPTDAVLSNMLRTGQLDKSGFDWIVSAGKQGPSTDDLATYDQFQKELNAGTLKGADVMDAASAGLLTHATAKTLIKAVEDPAAAADAVGKANFATLKNGLFAGADTGFAMLSADQRQITQSLWAQAQQEWTQRVLINHEDSNLVLKDMVPRYQQNAAVPPGLPQPKFGPVIDMQSAQAAAVQTKAAHDAGTMDDDTFKMQKALISQYLGWYVQKQQQDATVKGLGKPVTPTAGGQTYTPDTQGSQP